MNAPKAVSFTLAQMIPLADIVASPTNPRKTFDQSSLDELTASVRAHGVIQPILVRPVGNTTKHFELVAGERRWRAAKAAGLAEIPATVRTLSDLETLELQVVENLQRSDLHPLEEAEGYEQLMKKHGLTADDLAAKVGKSKAYIYARLKLTALTAAGREAFYAGKLNPSTALLVARLSPAKVQDEALKEITAFDYRGEPLSVRTAAETIQRAYMLQLDRAPFKPSDEKLLPKAGSCTACPKRTGNQPELFADVKSGDVCTDKVCFAAKRTAHCTRQRQAAEAEGYSVVSGNDAKRYLNYGTGVGGYVRLDDPCPQDEKWRSYARILGKEVANAHTVMVEDQQTHELVACAKRDDLKLALEVKGIATPRDRSAEAPGSVIERKAPRAVRFRRDIRLALLRALYDQPLERISWQDIVEITLRFLGYDVEQDLLKVAGLDAEQDDLRPQLEKLGVLELTRLMLLHTCDTHSGENLEAICGRRGIDIDAISKAAIAAGQEREKAEKAAASEAAKAKATKPAKKAKA
jgi:ParB/RepB/Spo0J family partition protein